MFSILTLTNDVEKCHNQTETTRMLASEFSLLRSNSTITNSTRVVPAIYSTIINSGMLAIAIVFLPIFIAIFIMLIIFTKNKQQPVHSRFLSPWFGTIYQILYLVSMIVVEPLVLAKVVSEDQQYYYWFCLILLFHVSSKLSQLLLKFLKASLVSFMLQTLRYYAMRG